MGNSIQSMTAYANSQAKVDNLGMFSCEIKTVNSKFLDLNIKLPDTMNFIEPKIRSLLTKKMKRGKVDFSLHIKFEQGFKFDAIYNNQLEDYMALHKNIIQKAEYANIQPDKLQVTDVLRYINLMDSSQFLNGLKDEALEQISSEILKLGDTTAEMMLHQRHREGGLLKLELLEISAKIKDCVGELESLLPKVSAELKAKHKQKLMDAMVLLLDEKQIQLADQQDFEVKLAQELAIYLNKADVNEEISRLKYHIEEVDNILYEGGLAGRKLDFLMQELMRESNTLSAKSISIDFRNIAVSLKVYIEQMREQIQNIE